MRCGFLGKGHGLTAKTLSECANTLRLAERWNCTMRAKSWRSMNMSWLGRLLAVRMMYLYLLIQLADWYSDWSDKISIYQEGFSCDQILSCLTCVRWLRSCVIRFVRVCLLHCLRLIDDFLLNNNHKHEVKIPDTPLTVVDAIDLESN